MYRYTLHVPRALNDGAPVSAADIAAIERDLLALFGGFTATEAVGAWAADDGTIYRDPVTVYTLDADDPRPEVFDIARAVAVALAQEAVYVTATAPDGSQARALVTGQVTA